MRDPPIMLEIAVKAGYGYTLAINFRNVSGLACALNRSTDEPLFS